MHYQVDQYTALKLEEYKGIYSILQGFEGKDGDFKNSWIIEEWGKEKEQKKMPKRIKLGDAATAKKMLEVILAQLTEVDAPGVPQGKIDGGSDSAPF